MTTSTSILWNNPDYRAWFAGDTSAKFVGSLRAFALPLAVVALTGSATQAGLIATASQAIGILCMIPGGVVVDRIDRRKLLYTFAALGTIIWTTIAILFALEALTFPVLITLTSLGAVNGGLFGQTTDVVLRTLVHGENLVKASAANHGRDATIEVAAPPAGAALFALGSWVPFAASVVGYLLLGLCARLIHHDLRPRADDASETGGVRMLWVNFANDVVDAYRYVRAHPTILQLLTPPRSDFQHRLHGNPVCDHLRASAGRAEPGRDRGLQHGNGRMRVYWLTAGRSLFGQIPHGLGLLRGDPSHRTRHGADHFLPPLCSYRSVHGALPRPVHHDRRTPFHYLLHRAHRDAGQAVGGIRPDHIPTVSRCTHHRRADTRPRKLPRRHGTILHPAFHALFGLGRDAACAHTASACRLG
ncbi:MFS transporter [Trueperella pyogenes]|uniref:MFS transporter n=1 Tax=Trueperella pyogenes TaxID=1661 RepID=UPI0009B8E5A7|nr:MFS transporter [Trueperella pyogenes]